MKEAGDYPLAIASDRGSRLCVLGVVVLRESTLAELFGPADLAGGSIQGQHGVRVGGFIGRGQKDGIADDNGRGMPATGQRG